MWAYFDKISGLFQIFFDNLNHKDNCCKKKCKITISQKGSHDFDLSSL